MGVTCAKCSAPLPVDKYSVARLYCKECRSERDLSYLNTAFARSEMLLRIVVNSAQGFVSSVPSRPHIAVQTEQRFVRVMQHYLISEEEWFNRSLQRPRTRRDCLAGGCNAVRPCPWIGCRYNLYLDVHPETGSIKLNYPEKEPWDMEETCALDIAEQGSHSLEEIASHVGFVRERVRLVELAAKGKLRIIMCRGWRLFKKPKSHTPLGNLARLVAAQVLAAEWKAR